MVLVIIGRHVDGGGAAVDGDGRRARGAGDRAGCEDEGAGRVRDADGGAAAADGDLVERVFSVGVVELQAGSVPGHDGVVAAVVAVNVMSPVFPPETDTAAKLLTPG